MRHLHIIQSLDVKRSGGLTGVLSLHEAMLRCGISSRLVYNEIAPISPSPAETRAVRPLWGNRFYFGWTTSSLLRLEIARADAVHVHGLYTYLSYVAGKHCRALGRPLIYHPHGTLAPAYLQRSACKKRLVHMLFENANMRQLAVWRALSDFERQHIQHYRPGASVIVVPNGVPIPSESSKPASRNAALGLPVKDSPRRVFLFLSRVAAVKGVDLLLAAWKAAGTQLEGCELWIAGPDFDGTGPWAKDFIVANGLGRVVVLGAVSELEKAWLLRAADVFVLPSRGEGQSSAILEAMAHGKAVLLTKTCYFPLAAEVGAGVECETAVGSIAGALTRLAGMPEAQLQECGGAGKLLIKQQYCIDQVARELHQKLTLILDQK